MNAPQELRIRDMRKLLLFFFLLLLCCAAVPFLIGYEIKQNFYHLVEVFPKDNPGLKILAVNYEQGWLSSKAQVKISISFPTLPSSIVESIDSDIHHGPLVKDPASGNLTLGLGRIDSQVFLSGFEVQTKSGDKSVTQINTLIDLHNGWHSYFTQPALSFSLPSILQFASEAAEGRIDFSFENNQLNEFSLFVDAKGFDLTFNQLPLISEMHFASFSYERQARHDPLGFWLGTIKANFSKVVLKKRDNSEIILQDFAFDGSTQRPQANLYDVNLHVFVKEIQTALDKLPQLGPLQLTIDIKNLSRNGIKDLVTFFEKPHQQPLTQEEQMAYMNLLTKLLTKTTLITENLSINSPFGTLDNQAHISWDSEAGLPLTFIEAINKINATVSLSIASALVDQLITLEDSFHPQAASIDVPAVPGTPFESVPTPSVNAVATDSGQKPPSLRQNIDAWVQQGYLIKDKDRYTVTIRRSNGAASINDKALPSP